MENGLLQSPQGDTSSKRVAGLILVVSGVVIGFIGAFTTNMVLVDYSKWIAIIGAGLLGIGVIEHIGK